MIRIFLIIGGTIAVGLGLLGIFLPILPTTPFLLLAAACYVRSSDKFYHWLIQHKWFGKYIRDYREKRGIQLRAKVLALCFLWLTIGYSIIFVISLTWVRLLILGVAIGVTVHITSLNTL